MSHEGDEEFWFRFVSLSESQVSALRSDCGVLEVRPKRNAQGLFVASLRLNAETDYEWLPSFVKNYNIAESTFGVFISLATTHDSEIVTLPAFVLDLHRRTGGQIEFSFTVVSNEPEQQSAR